MANYEELRWEWDDTGKENKKKKSGYITFFL